MLAERTVDASLVADRKLDGRAVLLWQVENALGTVFLVVLAAVLIQVPLVPSNWERWVVGAASVGFALGLLDAAFFIPRRYRYYRYALTPDSLVVAQGNIWKRRQVYPLARILYCETRQGPVLAAFGLYAVRAGTIVGSRSIGPLVKAEADRIERALRRRATP